MADCSPTPRTVSGIARTVTLFEDRAKVVRRARVTLDPGAHWLAVDGVSAFVDNRSIRAEVVDGSATLVSARPRRVVLWESDTEASEIARLDEAHRNATREVGRLTDEIAGFEATRMRLNALHGQWIGALAAVPPGQQSGEDWTTAYGSMTSALAETLEAEEARRVEREVARDQQCVTRRRLDAAQITRPVCRAIIEVQLECQARGEVVVDVTYDTPCALWRPEHHAHHITPEEGDQGEVEWTTYATVWQATGEVWEDVELRLSTARPSKAGRAPLLAEEVLATRAKTDEEKAKVSVELRDETIQVAGLKTGRRRVDEMPGVDDGGAPLELKAGARVSIPSDGRPFRVEIRRFRTPAALSRVLMGERATVAHFKAVLTLTDDVPVLAGPVHLARGDVMVGRGQIEFVAPGEPFELGFGPDDGLRVKRRRHEERDRARLTGVKLVERTVDLYLSNLSNEVRTVDVQERIPVSEIDDVEIRLDAQGWDHDRDNGIVSKRVMVPANGTLELSMMYVIRAKPNVNLPF